MSNEIFEVVRTVMAIREYDGRPLPDDLARRIVEAGHLTASASNRQPWHFVLVRDPERVRKLGSLIRTGRYTSGAAAAVIVAYEKDKGEIGLSDASRAIQSMMLSAWGDGIASNWTGFAGRLEVVGKEFGVPDTHEVLAVVPFGYPKQRVIGRKKRKPLSEVASAERFGTALT